VSFLITACVLVGFSAVAWLVLYPYSASPTLVEAIVFFAFALLLGARER